MFTITVRWRIIVPHAQHNAINNSFRAKWYTLIILCHIFTFLAVRKPFSTISYEKIWDVDDDDFNVNTTLNDAAYWSGTKQNKSRSTLLLFVKNNDVYLYNLCAIDKWVYGVD